MESKLSVKLKNTPKDTSLVLCSVSGGLNKEETLSVHYKVLADNLGEENRLLKFLKFKEDRT
ncbi:MAG: hypothetical protein ACTSYA_06150 [Candidatus Kariarchaeaceae archaeon]